MQILRSKKIQLGITLVLCVMIIATGSIAWLSATQKALNEFTFSPEGVNLHDDFNDPNKDVYVENSGTEPLLVRVKFREYTEIGKDITIPDDPDVEKRYPDTWPDHAPKSIDPTTCELEDAEDNNIHDYWEWIMGGEAKWYVPADEAQVDDGTQEWEENQDEVPAVRGEIELDGLPSILKEEGKYDTYEELCDAIEADTKLYDPSGVDDDLMFKLDNAKLILMYAILGQVQEEIDKARMDLKQLQDEINKHTLQTYGVQLTRPSTVLSMSEWIRGTEGSTGDSGYRPAMMPGDYWVVDSDGWCYWATPLEAGEATGLLLSEVLGGETLRDNRTRYYYGIDVIMQAATAEDASEFWNNNHPEIKKYGAASEDAQKLLALTAMAIDVNTGTGSTHPGNRSAMLSVDTEKGMYWYLSGDVWKFYDGQWRYDGKDWTLDGEEYPFDPDGWFMSDGEWQYIDDEWAFDGMEWTCLSSTSNAREPDIPAEDAPAVVEEEQEADTEENEENGNDPEVGIGSSSDETDETSEAGTEASEESGTDAEAGVGNSADETDATSEAGHEAPGSIDTDSSPEG